MNNPKRLLVVILSFVLLFSFVFITTVKAEDGIMPLDTTTFDNSIYRYVEARGFNNEYNGYEYYYRVYTSSGIREKVIYIPTQLHDEGSWFIYTSREASNNTTFLYHCDIENVSFTLVNDTRLNVWQIVCGQNFDRYMYVNGNWEVMDSNLSYKYLGKINMQPSSIVTSKRCDLKFCDMNLTYKIDWSFFADWQDFQCPDLKLADDYFRLYMNDIHGSTIVETDYEVTNSLTSLGLYIYDFNSQTSLVSGDSILSLSDLQQDEDGRYYVDIPLSRYAYLTQGNGDFLIGVGSVLNSTKTFNLTPAFPSQTVLYEDLSYWRYQYYSSSGSGLLVPSDAEGNPREPDDPIPEPEPDPTEEAIKNQTEKIEEQTEAIKEQTEVSKNIFQQIIELPRKNN